MAPLARLLAATGALALIMAPASEPRALGAALQQSDPQVVVLGYAHGPFPAGERVPLVRVIDGSAQGMDQGCSSPHLHSSPCSGPQNPGIMICDNAGQTFGRFSDQNPCNCGHGVIDLLRADLELLSVEAPSVVASGTRAQIIVLVRNNGPDTVDDMNLGYELVRPGGEPTGEEDDFSVRTATPIRQGETIEISYPLLINTSLPSIDVVVHPELVLVRRCGPISLGNVLEVPDPNLANNTKRAQMGVLPTNFGLPPAPLEAYRALAFSRLRVVSATGSGGLGIAASPSGGQRGDAPIRHSLLRGDGTGGFAPTPFQVDCASDDLDRGLFADFNDDGRTDLACPDGENVRVALGTATGRAGRARTFPSGGDPVGFVTGDFDGDGDPDLASILRADPTGAISVLRGNGRGGFGAPIVAVLPGDPAAIVAADLDGDDRLDLAVALSGEPTDGPGSVAVLLGDGAGGFTPSTIGAVGVRPVRIAAGDFNADGAPDLVTANAGSNSISVLIGDGSGGFAPGVAVEVGANPADLAVGDFNGSGTLDVAVACEGSDRLSIVLGDGMGEFFNAPVRVGAGQVSVAALDANGDGRLDMAVATDPVGSGRGSDDGGAIRIFLNDAEPVARPEIASVEVMGAKALVVTGVGFEAGATILVDGVRQKTVADASSPATRLTAKKGAKKIASGQTAVVQVEMAAGVLSEWALFTRP